MPAGGSCLLGSINLNEFVDKKNKTFKFDDFSNTVKTAVIALNEVLDEGLPLHPLKEQRDSVRDWRQIGLGVMGIADMLINLNTTYGSKESIKLCDKIAFLLSDTAIRTSALLAKEYGAFPKCDKYKIMDTPFFKHNTTQETAQLVEIYGMRNSQLLTIAPTGTLSTILGISGGIEPIFANYYTRKTQSLHGNEVSYKVYTPIVSEYMTDNNITDDKDLPEFFITSQNIPYKSRIDMQSVWQSHIDASISSTVNLANSATIKDIEELYMYAWEKGLRGITVYRDGCKRSGILTTDNTKTDADDSNSNNNVKYNSIIPISRKTIGTTHGDTFCKKTACGTSYITLNRDDNGNIVECFVNTSKGGICKSNIDGINRMISLALRSGVKVDEIVDQLSGITCQACIKVKSKGEDLSGLSCPDTIARTLKEFSQSLKDCKEDASNTNKEQCPECKSFSLTHEGGCVQCGECGWSKCS